MNHEAIVTTIQSHYPDVQAIYLFGSYGTEYERTDSDVDLALLLPIETAKMAGALMFKDCWTTLGKLLHRTIDLVNLRLVNTVFQNEIINTGRLVSATDQTAVDEFEMVTWSLYQKLNEERAEILGQIIKTKRIYNL